MDTTISRQSMRSFLAHLAEQGELQTIAAPVALDFELAACLAHEDGGRALRFDDVGRGRLPVVGNLLNSLPRIAMGLGVAPASMQTQIVAAMAAPLAHRIVTVAPCQAQVVDTPDLAAELPIPRFFEGEDGPYITAGLIAARDAHSGVVNLSIARLRPVGGNRAFVGIAPNHHLAVMAREAQARGTSLEIAVCIGNHPAVMFAACLYLGLGDDEMKVAGALLGEPLEVVRALSVDLHVPAQCECVLEGHLDARLSAPEGPVSEFHGMYETYGPGIVATFEHLTRRHDALFQVVLPGYHREHCLIGGVAIAAGLARSVRAAVPCLREVAVGFGGAGRLHAVLSLDAPRPGEARKAMFAIWAAVNLVKRVVVVDGDIDPWNEAEVEWALATRFKADRDLVVVPGVRADRSEPLEALGVVAKLGIDATRREADRPDWRRAAPPESARVRARELLGHTPSRSKHHSSDGGKHA